MNIKAITPITNAHAPNDPSQTSTYIGRVASSPSRVPPNSNMPTPHNGDLSQSTHTYEAKAISPQALRPIGGLAEITPENLKRRQFFLLLQHNLAQAMSSNNSSCDTQQKSFDRDGYYRSDNSSLSEMLICLGSCCVLLGRETIRCIRSEQQPPEDTAQFAARCAIGLVYQYQDQIPLLTEQSQKKLVNYFVEITSLYVFSGGRGDFESSSIYKMLSHRLTRYDPRANITLQTDKGFTFTIRHLLSLGIRTLSDAKYNPKDRNNLQLFAELQEQKDFPHYRQGTFDFLLQRGHMLNDNRLVAMNFTPVRDADYHSREPENSEQEFWKRAEVLAHQYLTSSDYAFMT